MRSRPTHAAARIQFLTQQEMRNLLQAIDSKRDYAIFLLAYRHGLRASEIGLLQTNDLDLTQHRIHISPRQNYLYLSAE